MGYDIKLDYSDCRFKLRVVGVVVKDNKLLVQKFENSKTCQLPGGHLEIGEDSKVGVTRELEEELNFKVEADKLLLVHENFFKNRYGLFSHEVAFYYKVNIPTNIETKDFVFEEMDKGVLKKLYYTWFSKENLEDINLKPDIIKTLAFENNDNVLHKITYDL